jgi:hypothetical protein
MARLQGTVQHHAPQSLMTCLLTLYAFRRSLQGHDVFLWHALRRRGVVKIAR